MITLIPAIDLIDGRCVRLSQGDYNKQTVYGDHPADVAREFERLGFKRLHVVDLDGARSAHIVNDDVLRAITEATQLEVDFGGGIKTDADIEKAFAAGAAMVTVGSVAVTHPERCFEWLERYGAERIILGADCRDGLVAINGWKDTSRLSLLQFLRPYIDKGVRKVLCTDIARDGMLGGPATALYQEVLSAYPGIELIASGGVSGDHDLLSLQAAGVPSVVFGKAFYEGRITLTPARLAAMSGQQ